MEDLVVVGVDGSEAGRRALRWALHEAARRGSAVEVLTAWSLHVYEGGGAVITPEEREQEGTRKRQSEVVAAELAALDLPAPTISQEVVEGDPITVLTQASRRAAFLVVGSHGHGRLRSALLGSVSEGCIRHATCPVVVVPAPHPDEEPLDEVAITGH